jgi:hypothetical protein
LTETAAAAVHAPTAAAAKAPVDIKPEIKPTKSSFFI